MQIFIFVAVQLEGGRQRTRGRCEFAAFTTVPLLLPQKIPTVKQLVNDAANEVVAHLAEVKSVCLLLFDASCRVYVSGTHFFSSTTSVAVCWGLDTLNKIKLKRDVHMKHEAPHPFGSSEPKAIVINNQINHSLCSEPNVAGRPPGCVCFAATLQHIWFHISSVELTTHTPWDSSCASR